jgi:formate-dependent nitrite reductase membrane component NrfD
LVTPATASSGAAMETPPIAFWTGPKPIIRMPLVAAAELLLGGRFTAPFWTLVVIGGLLVPALLETLESKLHYRVTAMAPLLVLAGGFALRWIFVAAGQV